MKIKEGKSALEQNLYRSFLLLSATLVLISLGFTLFFDISRQRKDMDKLISGTASYIAAIPDVAAMLENGYPDSTVTRDLDSLSLNIPDINVILISDKNGLRFYHTNRLKTGDSYVAGDEDAILAGSDPYITTGYGTHCDPLTYAMCVEELSKVCGTTGVIVSAHTSLCCDPIQTFGTEEQKQKYLVPLAKRKMGFTGRWKSWGFCKEEMVWCLIYMYKE